MWKISLFSLLIVIPNLAAASEKVFLALPQSCYISGGNVLANNHNNTVYSEVFGSLDPVRGQVCLKSFFDTRQCSELLFYNFQIACRGGVANAPQLFMALFGRDKEQVRNDFAVIGSQLTYIDPVRDFSGNSGRRVYLPQGYAPLHTATFANATRRMTWDDARQRPTLSKSLNADQEKRISDLFVTRAGFVEPFPESNIAAAVAISEEKPKPPVSLEPPPKTTPNHDDFLRKPVSEATAIAIFLFFLYAAMKELIKSRATGQFKIIVAIGIAGVEYAIYSYLGVKPDDPKIVDIIAMNLPIATTAGAFWLYSQA